MEMASTYARIGNYFGRIGLDLDFLDWVIGEGPRAGEELHYLDWATAKQFGIIYRSMQ
jgi:hypothetical protein